MRIRIGRLGSQLVQLAGGLQPGHARHRDVEYRQVQLLIGGELERGGAVGGFGGHFEVRLFIEYVAQAASHERVVVGEQDPRLQPRHGPATNGNVEA